MSEVEPISTVVMPKEARKESAAIKKKVKDVTQEKKSVEEGLKVWEESCKQAIESGQAEQALINHWRALKYLHKLQLRVTEGIDIPKKPIEEQKIIGSYVASAALLKREPPRLLPVHVETAASISKTDSPARKATSKARASSSSSTTDRPLVTVLSALSFSKDDPFDKIVEADGKPVKHLKPKAKFENFGGNIKNKPGVTFEPVTRTGVANIVKWAAANGKAVRAAGYRHTWATLYSDNDQVLVSMIPVARATHHNVISPEAPKLPKGDELEFIQLIKEETDHAFVRVGASTSNDQFRVWCLSDMKWSLPMSVDLVEITFGGSTTPMCHGTGITHPTMADLVTEIEFINAKGDLQIVRDPQQLRCAAGSLGLLGIVTAMTIRVEKMSYANMKPKKIPAMLGVPPPPGWNVPKELQIYPTEAELIGAQKTFEHQIEHDFYNEWFWFPFQDKVFVNCWHNDGDKSKSKNLSDVKALLQNVQGILGSITNTVLSLLPGDGGLQTKFVSWSAMQVLPDMTNSKEFAVTPIIEAFYFRRGLHNMPMLDMELIIPIPGRKDKPEKPDWTIVNRAWWACINKVYEYSTKGKYPLRLGLAMHIISDSNMLLAATNGNMNQDSHKHKTFGSCSINISTIPQTPQDLWQEFSQDIANDWNSYTFPDGTPLNVRAHWVKEWEKLSTPAGVPLPKHYRDVAYKDKIPEFVSTMKKIASVGGYKVKDCRARFSNPFLEPIIFGE